MTCCGEVIEVTDNDDPQPVYLCRNCGKQGPARMFPDPQEPEQKQSLTDKIRWRIAEWIAPNE